MDVPVLVLASGIVALVSTLGSAYGSHSRRNWINLVSYRAGVGQVLVNWSGGRALTNLN